VKENIRKPKFQKNLGLSFQKQLIAQTRLLSILGLLALICAICELITPMVEVSCKEGGIPLSCSELLLTNSERHQGYYLTGKLTTCIVIKIRLFR